MITKYLENDNLIICPNTLKNKVIKEINTYQKLVSYKVMDLREWLNNYFFSYSKKTIFYVMKELNVKYEIAIEYLESLYFIQDKEYQFPKLNQLKELKKRLIEYKLLDYNPFFQNYLINTNVILYGYNHLDSFYTKIFSKLPSYHEITITNSQVKRTVYYFDDIEEEIAYLCHDIKKKLDSNIPIEKIKIIKPSSEYINPIKRIFLWCHIPLLLEEKVSLYDISIGKEILSKIEKNIPFIDIIDLLTSEKIDEDILNLIISVFNEYIGFDVDTKELLEMIRYDFKHTYLPTCKKENCIEICNIEEVTEDLVVYVVGFNKENYPMLYKDEEFLSDQMKEELGLFDSNQMNINSMKEIENYLNTKASFTISYKSKDAFRSYNPSLLIKKLDYEVIENPFPDFNISNIYNEIILAKELDKYYKYGITSEYLKILNNTYPNIPYKKYQNQFNSINTEEFISNLKQPFNLSYSTIDEYYHCGFRYYISNILKIKEQNSDEFYRAIGNIFHYVLSQIFNKDFDFEVSWQKEASKYDFAPSKTVLLEKLKEELQYDIEIIFKQQQYSDFNDYFFEKKFSLEIPNNKNVSVYFVGIVDKISYRKEDNRTLVSVIDYKTGTLPSNLNNIVYGIGMQLPIYLYFIKRSELLPNLEIVGFYLQKIINKNIKYVPGKTIEELREENLKLVGYSTDCEELLEKFDSTYEDSKMIQGLKRKKEGFYAYSKILNKNQMKQMDYLVSQKIKEATDEILNANFAINPKKIGQEIIGCEFCSYRDICYRTEKDIVELPKHRNLDFLGGEEDA